MCCSRRQRSRLVPSRGDNHGLSAVCDGRLRFDVDGRRTRLAVRPALGGRKYQRCYRRSDRCLKARSHSHLAIVDHDHNPSFLESRGSALRSVDETGCASYAGWKNNKYRTTDPRPVMNRSDANNQSGRPEGWCFGESRNV